MRSPVCLFLSIVLHSLFSLYVILSISVIGKAMGGIILFHCGISLVLTNAGGDLPDLDLLVIRAWVELECPWVLLNESFSLLLQAVVWYHDVGVNFNQVNRALARLFKLPIHFENLFNLVALVSASTFYGDWIRHELAAYDANQVLRNEEFLSLRLAFLGENGPNVSLQALVIDLLILWDFED